MRILFFTLFLFTFAPFVMAAENGVATSSQTEVHTHYCPMHPEETGMEGDNCPICGMHLVPMEDKAMDMGAEQTHENHNHEMHSPAAPTKDADGKQVYICPMHPHITGEEGDNCPICGMHLVPMEDKAMDMGAEQTHENHNHEMHSPAAPTKDAEVHTHYCPMHPEETGMEGDNCPICGMHLVPMEDKAMDMGAEQTHENHNHEMHSPAAPTKDADGKQVYICPMHPHITGEEGDNCPICGMHLVPKNDGNGSHEGREDKPEGAFLIDPSYIQTLGVKTSGVSHHEFGKSIRAFGKITPSTRLEYAVDVRTKGWIVDLAVDAVGDTVKKGDLLFTYYSPDLMNAQSDFLIGSRVGNGVQRLRLYGMEDKAIAELKERGKFFEETPFYAHEDGTVTMLNVRKGAHVNEGGGVLKLQDFSKLWVNADVPLRDVQFLEVGTPAKITIPETGEKYEALVDFIHPVNDPQNRTVTVRLVLDNPDGALKPDTYVDTAFNAKVQSRLAVPAEAVLYSGMGAYVIEDAGDGYFRPVMVETGITSQGLTEITSGLSHGQSIVKSGQFMLDAESNLKGGMAAMGHDHGGEQMEGMTSQPTSQEVGQSHAH